MDGLFSRDRVANARNGDRGSQGGLAPHHPDRKFPTGCAGAATRIFQRDLPGLLPRFFFALFRGFPTRIVSSYRMNGHIEPSSGFE